MRQMEVEFGSASPAAAIEVKPAVVNSSDGLSRWSLHSVRRAAGELNKGNRAALSLP
jgi:hypothetical protein